MKSVNKRLIALYKSLWIITIVLVALSVLTIFLPSIHFVLENNSIYVNGLTSTFGGRVNVELVNPGIYLPYIPFEFNYIIFIAYAFMFVILFGVCYSYSTESNAIATFIMLILIAVTIGCSKQIILLITHSLSNLGNTIHLASGPIICVVLLLLAASMQLGRIIMYFYKKKLDKKEGYTIKFVVNSSLVDRYKRLKITSLLQMIQDISVSDCKLHGYTSKDLDNDKLHWVVTSLNMVIDKMPKYNETVVLTTYPQKTMHFIYPRQYILKTLDGKVLARAIANWMIVDTEKRTATLPSANKVFINGTNRADALPFNQHIIKQPTSYSETRNIRASDIDLNNHFNNVRYAEYFLDMYSSTTFEKVQPREFSIRYHREVFENEVVTLSRSSTQPVYFTMKNASGELIAEASLLL